MRFSSNCRATLLAAFLCLITAAHAAPVESKPAPTGPVSYYKQIRPIFQAQCQGCHQPAKAKGGYVMTDFAKLLAAGDSEKKAVIPGKPANSHLIEQITPKNNEAEMPKGKTPLASFEIDLITKWIAEGAIDDTPANARQRIDAEHPPTYTRPPVITSVDYSPDGSLLAVAGFHEVLLHKADGSGLVARLVGLSERIESVRFSPDGKWLAVAGGQPARMGEIQIWNVASNKLSMSVPVTYDTVYGASWSPDSKLVAFGCSDNTIRAIEAATGKQVLQQGSHSDWVINTAFSTNGDYVISVGRDMTAKLTETATQRFVDNITSITPGALRGGLHALARHPSRDEIIVGGSDGIPQIFRVFRQTARKIGDNATLIRKFTPMDGRIYSAAYSPDGNRIVACSSLDGTGAVNFYSAAFDSSIPTNLVKVFEKTVSEQTKEEKEELEKYFTTDVKLIAKTAINAGVYSVSYSPDGKTVAAAGQDGIVRLINPDDGQVMKEFVPVPVKNMPLARPPGDKPTRTASRE